MSPVVARYLLGSVYKTSCPRAPQLTEIRRRCLIRTDVARMVLHLGGELRRASTVLSVTFAEGDNHLVADDSSPYSLLRRGPAILRGQRLLQLPIPGKTSDRIQCRPSVV